MNPVTRFTSIFDIMIGPYPVIMAKKLCYEIISVTQIHKRSSTVTYISISIIYLLIYIFPVCSLMLSTSQII